MSEPEVVKMNPAEMGFYKSGRMLGRAEAFKLMRDQFATLRDQVRKEVDDRLKRAGLLSKATSALSGQDPHFFTNYLGQVVDQLTKFADEAQSQGNQFMSEALGAKNELERPRSPAAKHKKRKRR